MLCCEFTEPENSAIVNDIENDMVVDRLSFLEEL